MKMNRASSFEKVVNPKNLHSIVWPAGAGKNGCKKAKNDCLSYFFAGRAQSLQKTHIELAQMSPYPSIYGIVRF